MSQTTNSGDFAAAGNDLEWLEQSRRALKQAVAVALRVERLQTGLRAALDLGRPARRIPAQNRRFLDELNEQIRHLGNDRVKELLAGVDRLVEQQLGDILRLARDVADEDGSVPDEEDRVVAASSSLLADFQRRAYTAVAMRLLLRERNVPVPPLEFGAQRQRLVDQLQAVEVQEERCRRRLHTQMTGMVADVEGMLAKEETPDGVRQILLGVRADLRHNLECLEAGQHVERLPIVIEAVELGEGPAAGGAGDEGGHEAADAAEVAGKPAGEPGAAGGPSFWKRLRLWLNTPWGTTWRDVRRLVRRGKG